MKKNFIRLNINDNYLSFDGSNDYAYKSSVPEEKNLAFTKKKIIINDKKVKRVYCTTTNIKIAYCKNNYLYIKKPGKVTLNFYTKNNNKKLKKTIKVDDYRKQRNI